MSSSSSSERFGRVEATAARWDQIVLASDSGRLIKALLTICASAYLLEIDLASGSGAWQVCKMRQLCLH